MGGAAALLSPRRAAVLAAAVAALVSWNAGAGLLPDFSHWPDVLIVSFVLLPLAFAVPALALPLARSRLAPALGAVLAALALLLYLLGAASLFNVTKLLALTALGFWFLQVFEALSWVVLIACVIPWIDIVSVWRGPTQYVVSEQPNLFERVSIAFRAPGEEGSANIGPPDILFFALFLAAADRFGLRVWWTWGSMVTLLGLTLILSTAFDLNGLPALPAISLGFLVPNADLIWKAWRARGLELS